MGNMNTTNKDRARSIDRSVKIQRHRPLKLLNEQEPMVNQPKTMCIVVVVVVRSNKPTPLQAKSCCKIHTSGSGHRPPPPWATTFDPSYIQFWIQPTLTSVDPSSQLITTGYLVNNNGWTLGGCLILLINTLLAKTQQDDEQQQNCRSYHHPSFLLKFTTTAPASSSSPSS